ncbi:hypothetical protein CEXT_142411 [Caerostris extrusa]|uniref:Uncharacterized protein n=1 Tax=Caerostris extrusa TaxID=172846 RepID=A0AAV4ULC4_CAEEX|nr:hypothetical protein CEXT_142411 [Caerostris extrusa]
MYVPKLRLKFTGKLSSRAGPPGAPALSPSKIPGHSGVCTLAFSSEFLGEAPATCCWTDGAFVFHSVGSMWLTYTCLKLLASSDPGLVSKVLLLTLFLLPLIAHALPRSNLACLAGTGYGNIPAAQLAQLFFERFALHANACHW